MTNRKVEAAKAEVRRLWLALCEYDNMVPTSFVVPSQGNPFTLEYNKAMGDLMRLRKARTARAARRDMIDSLGMHEVRGALGGRYIE